MTEASTDPNRTDTSNNASPRRRRFERGDANHPLTTAKLGVLRLVAESRFLSTPQVAALAGLSEKAARDHLRDLFDLGLTEAVPMPRVALDGAVFGLAAKLHVATRKGMDTAEVDGKPAKITPAMYAYLSHELCVRDVLVWLDAAARRRQEERVLRWNCGSVPAVQGIKPDAVFTYEFGERDSLVSGMVEVDMGTERGGRFDRWAAKIAGYAALFADEDRMGVESLTGTERARLVVTVPTQRRADWVLERCNGTAAEPFTWVAVRSELAGADMHAPVWRRADGSRRGFEPLEV